MKLTAKQLKESLRLSKINSESLYFTIKGVRYMKVGTRRNDNGSYSHNIKNLDMAYGFTRYKWVGDGALKEILK